MLFAGSVFTMLTPEQRLEFVRMQLDDAEAGVLDIVCPYCGIVMHIHDSFCCALFRSAALNYLTEPHE